jgi:hypothetical protein
MLVDGIGSVASLDQLSQLGVDPDKLEWEKKSNDQGLCTELADLGSAGVAVRSSKDPNGAVLVFSNDELASFFEGVIEGRFKHMITA